MADGEQQDTGQSEQAGHVDPWMQLKEFWREVDAHSKSQHVDGWGHLPSQERQDKLDKMLREWEGSAEHGKRKSAFDGVKLTGSDVFFLAARSWVGLAGDVTSVGEWSDQLKYDSSHLHLEGSHLYEAHLERANLSEANLHKAVLLAADLSRANLRKVDLSQASLRKANLSKANLNGANLSGAHLEYAELSGANLIGASLKTTQLNGALLDRASLDQTIFDNTNLAVVPWDQVHVFGDELQAQTARDGNGIRKSRANRRTDYEAAVRAHRQLAARLADQGMIEQANRFIYRALILQRKSHWFYFPRRFGTWIFSWILFLLAGYGYRPLRTLFWYLATIASFGALFFSITHGMLGVIGVPTSKIAQLSVLESVVLSVSSFHGRGFFQPAPGNNLGDPVFVAAAAEAVFGLFIEVSFIATFTQRFFSNR